jgi:tetrahydromethanopterin S-methyltransferase subunit B
MLGSAFFTSLPPGASVVAYSNGGTISQTLSGVSLMPNSIYTLSVYVGNRLDNLVTNYSLALDAGTTVLNSFSGSNGSIAAGTFANETLTYSTGSSVAAGNLAILLTSSGLQTDFANVVLSVNSIAAPEPSSLLMLGMGLLGLAWVGIRKHAEI